MIIIKKHYRHKQNKKLLKGIISVVFLSISYTNVCAENRLLTEDEDVFELSLQELLQIQVISVSKKPQVLADAAAAVFVISNEDIKRTGVTSVPEALRLAPGINVARINSHKWAISSRGFNGSFSNKLLVMIDGRSVYDPSFSGVYWDSQNILLEDVERIEVIRGPGASIWGANAVNGVINIISKQAKQTQGGLLVAGGGTEEKGFASMRYGVELNEDSHVRAYVTGFEKGEFKNEQGNNAGDDWSNVQAGFRLDSKLTNKSVVTFQGDVYRSSENEIVNFPQLTPPYSKTENDSFKNYGWNILTNFEHKFSDTSEYSVQFYYDHYERNEVIQKTRNDTLDIEFKNSFTLGEEQKVIWGLGYRYKHDDFTDQKYSDITPDSRNDQLFSAFVQDEIALLKNKLFLTLGSKFEHNDYSGFEIQPTARLMWKASENQRLWGAVSRAVRTPSRADHGVSLLVQVIPDQPFPGVATGVTMSGDVNFKSEELIAYEVGYRHEVTDDAAFDITAFYHDYDHLLGTRLGAFDPNTLTQATFFDNSSEGETYGVETSIVWTMLDWWRWNLNYSFLKTQLHTSAVHQQSISPNHQVSVRASIIPWDQINMDLWFRYVGEDQGINSRGSEEFVINDYTTLDLRVAWQANKSLELSLTGQNLLDSQHLEYLHETSTFQTEVPRGFYGKLEWQF